MVRCSPLHFDRIGNGNYRVEAAGNILHIVPCDQVDNGSHLVGTFAVVGAVGGDNNLDVALNVDVDAAHPQEELADGTGDTVDHNADSIVEEQLEYGDEDHGDIHFEDDKRDQCEKDQLDLLTS